MSNTELHKKENIVRASCQKFIQFCNRSNLSNEKKNQKHPHNLYHQSGKHIGQVCLPAHLCWEKLSRNQAMQCSGEDSEVSNLEEDCCAGTLTPRPSLPLSAKLPNWISAGLNLSSSPQSFYQLLWPSFVSTAPLGCLSEGRLHCNAHTLPSLSIG